MCVKLSCLRRMAIAPKSSSKRNRNYLPQAPRKKNCLATEPPNVNASKRAPLFAWLWLCVVLLVVFDQVQFWRAPRLDTDVLALLPTDEQQPELQAATRQMLQQSNQGLVILVGAADWQQTQAAAALIVAELAKTPELLKVADSGEASLDRAIEFYRPWRDRLLSVEQKTWLRDAPEDEVASRALMQLYQLPGAGMGEWRSDPLGLWPAWWAERALASTARPREGQLWLNAAGKEWILLSFESQLPAFSASGAMPLTSALLNAEQAMLQVQPNAQLISAGVPLFAESAAAQGNQEMSTIGLGSLAAVLLLVWWTFRSMRPILLVGVSLLIGCAVALSVTALLFERVHLLTLVFGASLVGVAEDYGFHYFAARQGNAASARFKILRHLLPGMSLALLTSVVAYLALGIAPFPGLRQIALFSAVGLLAAFLTVLCWFPLLDRGALPKTRFAEKMAASLMHWPRMRANKWGVICLVIAIIFVGFGLVKLQSQDDIRQLYSAPKNLAAAQAQVAQMLNLPSPSQYFLISAKIPELVLQRDTTFKASLAPLLAKQTLVGINAVSDWLPSIAAQNESAALVAKAENTALKAVNANTGETLSRAEFSESALLPAQWLASPAAEISGAQWLGEIGGQYYAVMLVRGLDSNEIAEVARYANAQQGVRWVDRTADTSLLLARYRIKMAQLLLLGLALVSFLLWLRFRWHAWRAVMPTIVGALITLALFGWLGIPLQLFSVLALILLLGMGVDYGIFLTEHPGDGSAWLAVALAGVSTLLSFGLLALSATPALHAFGLTMLIGELSIWLLTPCFRPPAIPPATAKANPHA